MIQIQALKVEINQEEEAMQSKKKSRTDSHQTRTSKIRFLKRSKHFKISLTKLKKRKKN